MPGQYSVAMLAMKYGYNTQDIRLALSASGVDIDANDHVDVDTAEKADKEIKAWLKNYQDGLMAAKLERAGVQAPAKAKEGE